MVDRAPFDRIVEAGGFITAATGGAPDANLIPIPKPVADASMDAAACIGCGACVAACPNGAASLFTGAKLAHLNLLPQGQAERYKRTEAMVETMDELLRLVHQPRRVRGGVPEGDLDRRDRHDERRLPQGEVQEPQVPQPHLTESRRGSGTLRAHLDLRVEVPADRRQDPLCGRVSMPTLTGASDRHPAGVGRWECEVAFDLASNGSVQIAAGEEHEDGSREPRRVRPAAVAVGEVVVRNRELDELADVVE